MKTRLFNMAWAIRKQFATFGEALAQAWRCVKLQWALCLGVVTFQYRKVDGSIRTATGTRDNIPAIKGTRPSNHSVVCYFDLDAQDYRSFKNENLLSIL